MPNPPTSPSKRCPTCGSDRPTACSLDTFHAGPNNHVHPHRPDDPYCCPDPFHTPDPNQEPGSEVGGEQGQPRPTDSAPSVVESRDSRPAHAADLSADPNQERCGGSGKVWKAVDATADNDDGDWLPCPGCPDCQPKGERCCCCGKPAPKRTPDPWQGRMDAYCEGCAETRCDAYPGACRAEGERSSEIEMPPPDSHALAGRVPGDVTGLRYRNRAGEFWRCATCGSTIRAGSTHTCTGPDPDGPFAQERLKAVVLADDLAQTASLLQAAESERENRCRCQWDDTGSMVIEECHYHSTIRRSLDSKIVELETRALSAEAQLERLRQLADEWEARAVEYDAVGGKSPLGLRQAALELRTLLNQPGGAA